MCYNETTSWIAFTIGCTALILAIARGILQKNVALIGTALAFISIVSIQLFEALLYKHCNTSKTTKVLRKVLLIMICIQPLVLFLSAQQYKLKQFDPYLTRACGIMLCIYIVLLFIDPPSIKKSEGCGKWSFDRFNVLTGVLYHLILLLSLLIPVEGGSLLFCVGLFTFLISLFMGKNQPSKWCILAALTPTCLLFVPWDD